jgi:hypothetical protein
MPPRVASSTPWAFISAVSRMIVLPTKIGCVLGGLVDALVEQVVFTLLAGRFLLPCGDDRILLRCHPEYLGRVPVEELL